jgi:adenosylhomocysteine nucleosidase
MKTIGLIAAMAQESSALLRGMRGWEKAMLGGVSCHRLSIREKDYWLVTSGVGMKRAMQAARLLVEQAHAQAIVSFGIAGAVYADLEIGDVVAASQACLLDGNVPGQFQPLAQLSTAAWEAAAQALQARGRRLLQGTTVTTSGSQVERLPESIPTPVLEMETAGILQVAAGAGIPLLSLRAISDGPRAPIPFDLAAVYDSQYRYRIGRMLGMILRKPRILLQMGQLIRNSNLAAENAALALAAVLGQDSLIVVP